MVPPVLKPRLDEPLIVDDADAALKQLLSRAALLQRNCAMAGQNLAIAQRCNTLRYAHVRSGSYQPKRHKFDVGDFA
jgi:hypothetical protein